jgi:hypothetical protein
MNEKRLNHRRLLSALLGLFLLAAPIHAADAEQKGAFDLAAFGLADMEEGTFEAWLSFPVGAAEAKAGRNPVRGNLLTLSSGADGAMTLQLTCAWKNTIGIRHGFVVDGGERNHPVYTTYPDYRKSTWTHFALTWKEGRIVGIFVDGKGNAAAKEKSFFFRITPDSQLLLGPVGGAALAVDEIRISSVARRPEDLGHAGPLRPDAATMLLLSFENESAAGTVTPVAAATSTAAAPWKLPAACRVADGGKFGRALYFCDPNAFNN